VRLIEPDGGTVLLGNEDFTQLKGEKLRDARQRVQMVFQDPFASLNPRRTVGAIIAAGPIAHGVKDDVARARARDLLGLVGLDPGAADRYPHEFSGGPRQRIAIARVAPLGQSAAE